MVSGYPPDILHDILEGIVPTEVSLCLSDLIGKHYFRLNVLNQAIRFFKYTLSDRTNRPQMIGKGFSTKGTIGGNAHENWCLIRLLPLLIGRYVPEGDNTWKILMLLKDIVELAVAPRHTEETLHFLQDCRAQALATANLPRFSFEAKTPLCETLPSAYQEVWSPV